MADVIDFFSKKKLEEKDLITKLDVPAYDLMSRPELLLEMVGFVDDKLLARGLTKSLIAKGIPLFTALERKAETAELRNVCNAFLKHLHIEMKSVE